LQENHHILERRCSLRKIVSLFLMVLPSFGALSGLQGLQPRTQPATLAAAVVSGQVLAPNLIYTSMQPCRLFDTRVAGGALVANTSRQFNAVGVSSSGSLSGQGGNASGCPIPGFDPVNSSPQVQAIVINLAVITPSGTGVLQAWPSDQSKPNASIMNFTAAEVVLANGAVLPVRQDAQGGTSHSSRTWGRTCWATSSGTSARIARSRGAVAAASSSASVPGTKARRRRSATRR
jgi:hypothetical protein